MTDTTAWYRSRIPGSTAHYMSVAPTGTQKRAEWLCGASPSYLTMMKSETNASHFCAACVAALNSKSEKNTESKGEKTVGKKTKKNKAGEKSTKNAVAVESFGIPGRLFARLLADYPELKKFNTAEHRQRIGRGERYTFPLPADLMPAILATLARLESEDTALPLPKRLNPGKAIDQIAAVHPEAVEHARALAGDVASIRMSTVTAVTDPGAVPALSVGTVEPKKVTASGPVETDEDGIVSIHLTGKLADAIAARGAMLAKAVARGTRTKRGAGERVTLVNLPERTMGQLVRAVEELSTERGVQQQIKTAALKVREGLGERTEEKKEEEESQPEVTEKKKSRKAKKDESGQLRTREKAALAVMEREGKARSPRPDAEPAPMSTAARDSELLAALAEQYTVSMNAANQLRTRAAVLRDEEETLRGISHKDEFYQDAAKNDPFGRNAAKMKMVLTAKKADAAYKVEHQAGKMMFQADDITTRIAQIEARAQQR